MEWRDEAIVLGLKRHGESSLIAEVMTRGHGRHLGIVRGGRGKRLGPVLQPGNSVEIVWRARLQEHLGQFAVEGLKLRAASLIDSATALYALACLSAHLRLLPERDPHEALYRTLELILEHLQLPHVAAALVVRFEIALLTELGFGLDLTCCAVSGATQELIYVSPKSGRAVSREAGDPYKDRLLPLPRFLNGFGISEPLAEEDLSSGFRLSGFFLERHVLEPRGLKLPEARAALVSSIRDGRAPLAPLS